MTSARIANRGDSRSKNNNDNKMSKIRLWKSIACLKRFHLSLGKGP